jgi:hypothetical protein
LIAWLEKVGIERIYLVDNDSSYEPLLEYYRQTPHTVIRIRENIGPRAFWERGIIDRAAAPGERYVLSDPDVVPIDECPPDAIERFGELLDAYPERMKVGFGLKLDDLPEHYRHRAAILEFERSNWERQLAPGVFAAEIDTTFALYRPSFRRFDMSAPSLRTGHPYVARHLPWYMDTDRPTDEQRFYWSHARTDGRMSNSNGPHLPEWMLVKLGRKRPVSSAAWARLHRAAIKRLRRPPRAWRG